MPKNNDVSLTTPTVVQPRDDNRGREIGTLLAGSIPWQLSQLAPGDFILVVEDSPIKGQNLNTTVARYKEVHGGNYTVQLCGGFPMSAKFFDGTAFRFYRILRTE
jgi:hypothetical protein